MMPPSRSVIPTPTMESATTTTVTTSYWCYSCTRFISVWDDQDANAGVVCPYCDGVFIEEIEDSNSSAVDAPAIPASQEVRAVDDIYLFRLRRVSSRDILFDPVIGLLGGAGAGERVENEDGDGFIRERRAYGFYYDDRPGSGLRPLPDSVSGIVMKFGNPPASKSAIESLPRVEISDYHIKAEANCAVCTEDFEAGTEGREMPCKHIFHGDCIVPWLSIRNSCPLCRFELHSDPPIQRSNEEELAVARTLWGLPGGDGFSVGRLNEAMREGERISPVLLTEMYGVGLGSNERPRRNSWARAHETPGMSINVVPSGTGGILRRLVSGMVSFMRRVRPNRGSSSSSSSSSSLIESRVMHLLTSLIRRFF